VPTPILTLHLSGLEKGLGSRKVVRGGEYWRKGSFLSLGVSSSLWLERCISARHCEPFDHSWRKKGTDAGRAQEMDTYEGKSIEELREFLIPIATSIAMCRLAAVAAWAALVYDWSKHHISPEHSLAFEESRSRP
jgi:hypothetical protein